MNRLLVLPFLACLLLVFPACGSADDDSGRSLALQELAQDDRPRLISAGESPGGYAGYYAGAFPSVPLPAAPGYGPGLSAGLSSGVQATVGGDPMSLARLGLEVASVEGATLQVQSIAASLGGYVERLTTIGVAEQARSDVTIKVPQEHLDRAMERIQGLGVVQYRSLGSEDVTDRHVDLTARLSALRQEEQSLSSLLDRSSSVVELLSVERELSRVRTDVERTQWQLELLERQVDLATIHVVLFPRGAVVEQGPAATFVLDVNGVPNSVAGMRQFVDARLGEIDEVYLASEGQGERAEIAFRVFPDDLNRAAQFIETQGRVSAREILDRPGSSDSGSGQSRQPSAQIHVTYLYQPTTISVWVPILIVLGILVVAGAITYLMRTAYSRGRRRGSFI
ncbi:MAG: DUF4349 domain-containing protein [Chloroflexota bacterium]|nr:DUF4349 domain-containing protein [Chloroflexota bacterium]